MVLVLGLGTFLRLQLFVLVELVVCSNDANKETQELVIGDIEE